MRYIQKGVVALIGVFIVAVIVGAIGRLALAHADTTALVNFVSTVGVLGVPTVAGWWNSKKARNHAVVARDAAVQTEKNTNGKLDIKFAVLTSLVKSVDEKVNAHLVYHDERDDDT